MKSTVTTKQAGKAIEVNVTHALDKKLYDWPLTARTTVPADWTSVQVTQGKDKKTVPAQQGPNGPFVQYQITPNAGVARLERQ